MWREDELYDVVVILGHNSDPPVPGKGSAIFLHCAKADYSPTEGCVALAKADVLALLRLAGPGSVLEVRQV
jgi:L,D-peptidoglycan transpeptidase YkuD (ErfK/YbiS/YcfS/YnhG family)